MKQLEITKIGLGTWLLGGDVKANINNDDERDVNAIIYALSNGINHIDTSESYSGGKSEELIGRAIKNFKREKLFIATKVREWNLEYDKIIESCYGSLKRLNTSYIDLYYIHKQDNTVNIKEVCKALNYLLDRGIIKNVGLSNVGINTIVEYNKYLKKKIYAVQNQYNLVCRESVKKGILDYCRNNDIKFICWRPILLTYPDCKNPWFEEGNYPIMDRISKKYGISNVQLAAKWLVDQENVYIIFKSNNCVHIQEILDVMNFKLEKKDWDDLNENFPTTFNVGCSTNEFFEVY